MSEQKSTVHDWLESFALGEERPVPSNCTVADLREYAATRFHYTLISTAGGANIKRICPACGR